MVNQTHIDTFLKKNISGTQIYVASPFNNEEVVILKLSGRKTWNKQMINYKQQKTVCWCWLSLPWWT